MDKKDWVINKMVSAHQRQQSTSNNSDSNNNTNENNASANQSNGDQQQGQEHQVRWNADLQTGTQGFQCGMCSHQSTRKTVDEAEQPINYENKLSNGNDLR